MEPRRAPGPWPGLSRPARFMAGLALGFIAALFAVTLVPRYAWVGATPLVQGLAWLLILAQLALVGAEYLRARGSRAEP